MGDSTERLYERILVVRCQAGDDSAFAELVERHSSRVRYYLRSLLGDSHTVEDVLQESLFDVYRGLPRLADTGAFVPWMYRIARDRAYRTLRRLHKLPQPIDDLVIVDTPQRDGEFTRDDYEQLHAALGTLVPQHREVLVLRFLEEMSYEDIARTIGCALGTVRSRIHYAKRDLRRAIEGRNSHE